MSDNPPFKVGDNIRLSIRGKGLAELNIGATIRHITGVRDKEGYKYICGVRFALETRALAADIEKLAAAIQRIHIRELSEKNLCS